MSYVARGRLLAVGALLLVAAAVGAAEVVIENWKEQPIGSRGIPKGWKEQSWGRPNYELFSIAEGSNRSLHMQSRGHSSSIAKDITGTVNLNVTPILEWSWRSEERRVGKERRALS